MSTTPWTGRWVWAADAPVDARTLVVLRTDVDLAEVPAVAPARVAAVGRYRLLVDGIEVLTGPPRTNPRRAAYDRADLGPYIRPGRHQLTILAWTWQGPMPWWHPLPGHGNPLQGGAVAFEVDLGDRVVGTDDSWQARVVPGWSVGDASDGVLGRGVERLDVRGLTGDWSRAVEVVPRAPGALPRSTPPSYPVGPVLSYPARTGTPSRHALVREGDVWRVPEGLVVGSLELDVEGPSGATVQVQVAERGRPTRHDAALEVVTDGSRRVVESLDVYGLRAAHVATDAIVRGVSVVDRTRTPLGAHGFSSDDPVLDAVWAAGRRTVTVCSLDTYVDCPTREQRAWVGDAVVHQLVDFATNDDWGLATWYPLMAASPRADGMLPMVVGGDAEAGDGFVIPDWALHWIHAVHTAYRYTGDAEAMAELLPVVEGVLRWFARYVDARGLPTQPIGGVLIDWAAVRTDGASAALAGLYGRALTEYAELCAVTGDHGRISWARQQHLLLSKGFEVFWDPRTRRYRDALVDGVLLPSASQHTHAAALVGGLVPSDRVTDVVARLTEEEHLVHASFAKADGPAEPNSELDGSAYLGSGPPEPWWDTDLQVVRAQPFFRYVVHDALDLVGRRDLLAGLCLDWAVLLERTRDTLSETWYGGTTCHAWSATPTRDLTTRVLGIEPAEPGFTKVRVAPALGHLAFAEGSAPTPFGPVHVRVEGSDVVVDSPVPVELGDQVASSRRRAADSSL